MRYEPRAPSSTSTASPSRRRGVRGVRRPASGAGEGRRATVTYKIPRTSDRSTGTNSAPSSPRSDTRSPATNSTRFSTSSSSTPEARLTRQFSSVGLFTAAVSPDSSLDLAHGPPRERCTTLARPPSGTLCPAVACRRTCPSTCRSGAASRSTSTKRDRRLRRERRGRCARAEPRPWRPHHQHESTWARLFLPHCGPRHRAAEPREPARSREPSRHRPPSRRPRRRVARRLRHRPGKRPDGLLHG